MFTSFTFLCWIHFSALITAVLPLELWRPKVHKGQHLTYKVKFVNFNSQLRPALCRIFSRPCKTLSEIRLGNSTNTALPRLHEPTKLGEKGSERQTTRRTSVRGTRVRRNDVDRQRRRETPFKKLPRSVSNSCHATPPWQAKAILLFIFGWKRVGCRESCGIYERLVRNEHRSSFTSKGLGS